jgi:methionine-rich copper-binding protein CopC
MFAGPCGAPDGILGRVRPLLRASAALLASLAVSLVSAGPAAAHGQLAESLPADGTKTDEPVEEITLYFTEPPPLDASLKITGPGGDEVGLGWKYGAEKRLREPVQELFLEDGQWIPRFYDMGYPAVLPVGHLPEPGKYTVAFSFTASDGDEVEGTTTFTYEGEPTAPSADAKPLPAPSVRPPLPDLDAAPTAPPVAATSPANGTSAAVAPQAEPVAAEQDEGGLSPVLVALVVALAAAAVVGVRLVVRRGTEPSAPSPVQGAGGPGKKVPSAPPVRGKGAAAKKPHRR